MNGLIPRRYRRAAAPALRDVRSVDRFFDDLWGGFALAPAHVTDTSRLGFSPRVNVRESADEIVITAELPGVEEKDFEVVLEDDVLTLKGEKHTEQEAEDGGYRHKETIHGRFERRFVLPPEVDRDAVKAAYKNGVLTVTVPKPAEPASEARTIPVTAS